MKTNTIFLCSILIAVGCGAPDAPQAEVSIYDLTSLPDAIRLHGKAAGIEQSSMPGARFVDSKALKQMNLSEEKSGLWLIDTDFIPAEMDAALEEQRMNLGADGTLTDAEGRPVLALVSSEVWNVKSHGRVPAKTFTIQASPYPWRCIYYSTWAIYTSYVGAKKYESRTWAAARYVNSSGACGGGPNTNIDYVNAHTAAKSGETGSTNACNACSATDAYDSDWSVDLGDRLTDHSAVWIDWGYGVSRSSHRCFGAACT